MQVVDPSEKGSECEDMGGKTPDGVSSEEGSVKTCADCGTSKTPLWRGGPAGPKSLCNACGIRSRKKRRALLGPIKGGEDKKSKKATSKNSVGQPSSKREGDNNSGLGDSMKKRLLAFGREVVLGKQKQRSKLGEEEQAAVLLMALSYGSVYA